jgi:hypothetical protein
MRSSARPSATNSGLRRAAGPERGVGREERGADGERGDAADDALEDAVRREPGRGAGSSATSRIAETTRLDGDHLAQPSATAGAHGEGHQYTICQAPVPVSSSMQRGDGDAEHDAGDELDGAAEPLAVRGADGDHGGDRRERGSRIRQQQDRELPRHTAAAAVWTIASRRPRRRRRAAPARARMRSAMRDGRIISFLIVGNGRSVSQRDCEPCHADAMQAALMRAFAEPLRVERVPDPEPPPAAS